MRHDPWELVVEAVKQMTAHNDVMRSDRLKQVMQEIDPSFDEKDVGFSRFSKFVQEAAHRGLIATARLDNGQYEIALGQRTGEAAATPGVRSTEAAPTAAPEAAPAPRRGSLVGDAFGLLKQALGRLGGEQEVSVETVREAMNELAPEGTRRVDSRSMPKLLRQAHDADLIDLSRDEGGAYSVRVRPEDEARPAAAATPPRDAAGGGRRGKRAANADLIRTAATVLPAGYAVGRCAGARWAVSTRFARSPAGQPSRAAGRRGRGGPQLPAAHRARVLPAGSPGRQ